MLYRQSHKQLCKAITRSDLRAPRGLNINLRTRRPIPPRSRHILLLIQKAIILLHPLGIKLKDSHLRIPPHMVTRPTLLRRRNLPQNIPMRHKHDIILWPFAQKLANPLRAVGESVGRHGPEALLGGPVWGQGGQIEGGEFGVFFEDLARGAGVAGEVVAFLGLREADYVFDAETLDGGAPAEFGRLEGAFEWRRDDQVDFFL